MTPIECAKNILKTIKPLLPDEAWKSDHFKNLREFIAAQIDKAQREAVTNWVNENYPGAIEASHSHAMRIFRDYTFPELAKLHYAEGFRAARDKAKGIAEGYISSGSLGGIESEYSKTYTYGQKETARGIAQRIEKMETEK